MKNLSIFGILTISWTYAFANRINTPVDPAARCSLKPTSQQCKDRRKIALQKKCITQEELDSLAKYNAFPLCDYTADKVDEYLAAWCPCGCYHPDTLIDVLDARSEEPTQVTAITLATKRKKYLVLSNEKNENELYSPSTYQDVNFSTIGPESKKLVHITTESGSTIKLTQKHPVVTNNGIKAANRVNEGDKLFHKSGEFIPVLKTSQQITKKDVVNFTIAKDSEDAHEHVIYAEGFATGDLYVQALIEDIDRQLQARMSYQN